MLETPEKVLEFLGKLYQKAKQELTAKADDWKAVFGKTERTV